MADDMLTSFANLYTSRPREAEHSDTRHEIRRHDPDQEKRKRQDEEGKSSGLFNEDDSATVSVDALGMFLQNFLATLIPPNTAASASVPNETSQEQPRPRQGNAAHAAHAYAHAAETKTSHRFVETSSTPSATSPGPDLPSEELRIIHQLLGKLKILSERNIENIRIERAETFLKSLERGVDTALGL